MKRFSRFLAAATVFVLFLAPRLAHADTIAINGGYVDFESYNLGNGQLLSWQGPALQFGFWFGLDAGRGGSFAASTCFSLPGCRPGSTLKIDANWSGSALPGTAILNGVSYDAGGSGGAQAALTLTGAILLPPAAPIGFGRELDAPFTLGGFFDFPTSAAGGVSHDTLVGGGTARIFLTPTVQGGWLVDSVLYQVAAPTPEPVSSSLLVVGFAALAIRRRSRSRGTRTA